MGSQLQAPKGVAEYVPPASNEFVGVRNLLARPLVRAGYGYAELPIFEDTALYVRGVGESTDVVSKEMYTFDDRGGRSLSLRPEGTAGAVRAVIEHGLDRQGGLPVKLWYSGPFFRAERPQAGRYRQFSQLGAEAIGSNDPALDAEVIAVAAEGLTAVGLTGVRLIVNSLGDASTREQYRDMLTNFLGTLPLDEQTRARAKLNPLRVLDDKRKQMKEMLTDAPDLSSVLSGEAKTHHQEVLGYLHDLGIAYEEDPRLVRGLDYYTRTTFEFVHDGLGAQSAVGGGGRYDGLMADLGGQALPGVGFAIGIDRVLLACKAEGIELANPSTCDVFLVPMGSNAKRKLVILAALIRSRGIRVDMAFGDRSIKSAMRAADKTNARLAVVMGDRDLEAGTAGVKNLTDGEQEDVAWDDLLDHIQEKLG